MHLDPLTLEGFHWDAYIIAIVLASVAAVVIRVIVTKTRRFLQHIIWMRRRSGGTLKKDAEAEFWLKTINRPDYKPIWRWTKAEELKKKHGTDIKKPKRRLVRGLSYGGAGVAIALAIFFLLSGIGGLIDPGGMFYIPTTTQLRVDAIGNLTPISAGPAGWHLRLNGTEWGGMYMGGAALLIMTIQRTDAAYSERDVFLNLQSGTMYNGTSYIRNVTYGFVDMDGVVLYKIEHSNLTVTIFGLPIKMPGRRAEIHFLVQINFGLFDASTEDVYATMTSTGSGPESKITISGGLLPCSGRYCSYGA